ncbi:MAG: VOC family protein [Saprospiraceae bacterium]|nr:VOC family protein [Saprospiraceae bacterium]MBL0100299.1 VOC family protein [Saprospiraceae bacterium]
MIHQHAVSWFEIPTLDLDRAKIFYETIMEITLHPMEFPGFKMLIFPTLDPMNSISGALVSTSPGFYNPSLTDGVLIYLNANPDVQLVLDRVLGAGGDILIPKTQISEDHGFMAVIRDTEGNRIALHAVPEK